MNNMMNSFKKSMKHMWVQLKSFTVECKRVLILTKKPTNEEFKTITKVTGLGMIIIGLIGFLIQIIKQIGVRFG